MKKCKLIIILIATHGSRTHGCMHQQLSHECNTTASFLPLQGQSPGVKSTLLSLHPDSFQSTWPFCNRIHKQHVQSDLISYNPVLPEEMQYNHNGQATLQLDTCLLCSHFESGRSIIQLSFSTERVPKSARLCCEAGDCAGLAKK